ncbi:hypothetical protein FDG04_07180 [Clostridium sporogenes]|nr:hypothetical protein [Clostridium sporogenes]NFQ85095.1 hypothetical protein [Clostridium sporogenes]
MYFFCSEEQYRNWVKESNIDEDNIFCLDIQEAVCVAKMLFSVTDLK